MAKEIERKFLVSGTGWQAGATGFTDIAQGYLSADPDRTVRVRVRDGRGYLTVKSRNCGAVRGEWEYEIPAADARELLGLCTGRVIRKRRYTVPCAGRVWEVDVFGGCHEGLVLAEVELESADAPVELPPFVGEEVTTDPRYYNSVLSGAPA